MFPDPDDSWAHPALSTIALLQHQRTHVLLLLVSMLSPQAISIRKHSTKSQSSVLPDATQVLKYWQ